MWIARLFGSGLVKYAAAAIAIGLFSFVAVPNISKAISKIAQFDTLAAEKSALVEQLATQDSDNRDRIAALTLARQQIAADHADFTGRAYRQINRLKNEINANADAKKWADTPIPDTIKRLRDGR
jgi:hypothetical protein